MRTRNMSFDVFGHPRHGEVYGVMFEAPPKQEVLTYKKLTIIGGFTIWQDSNGYYGAKKGSGVPACAHLKLSKLLEYHDL